MGNRSKTINLPRPEELSSTARRTRKSSFILNTKSGQLPPFAHIGFHFIQGDGAIIAGDFRIAPAGHQRFLISVDADIGSRRAGRVMQRLCEIETYKSMSMLGLARVRELGPRMGELDQALTRLVGDMSGAAEPDETLLGLLAISSELEEISARSSVRFGATGA